MVPVQRGAAARQPSTVELWEEGQHLLGVLHLAREKLYVLGGSVKQKIGQCRADNTDRADTLRKRWGSTVPSAAPRDAVTHASTPHPCLAPSWDSTAQYQITVETASPFPQSG